MEKTRERQLGILLIFVISLFYFWLLLFTEPAIFGQTYNNTSLVNTTVNITNAAPIVSNVVLPPTIDLLAYGNTTVQCNLTVEDFDNNTQNVNASFFVDTVSPSSPEDQNTRYVNTSCSRVTLNDTIANFTCAFSVNYFANNGTWRCNATAYDAQNAFSSNESNNATVNPLIAISTGTIIDYGQLGANQISNDTGLNITNVGNRDINITVEGYGATPGDNLAMVCTVGNIAVGNEHYYTTNGTAFGFMYVLSSTTTQIAGNFYVPQRTSETTDSINQTFWKLQVPSGAAGICNGTILFAAVDRGN